MKKKYIVTLTQEERQMLRTMVSRGRAAARKLVHARILLKADAASWEAGDNRSASTPADGELVLRDAWR